MNRSQGQGAARAKQLGLLLDLPPDGEMDDDGNDEELEAELMKLVGGGGRSPGKKFEGRAPVAMAEIERMAALCMKDLDDEEMGGDNVDDDDDDEDLLAELIEVLEDDDNQSPASVPPAVTPTLPKVSVPPHSTAAAPMGGTGLESRLQERLEMYETAISNAKAAGEMSKARRYDRGFKTLQSMMASVMKGRPINEDEIPPPVALGGKSSLPAESEPNREQNLEPTPSPTLTPSPQTNQKPLQEAAPMAPNPKPLLQTKTQKPAVDISPETPAASPLTPNQLNVQHLQLKQAVLSRQREYKIAALQAKQCGDMDQAKQHYLTAKKLDKLVEALDADEPVNLSSLPPSPGHEEESEHRAVTPSQSCSKPDPPAQTPVSAAELPAPSSLAEALQQRMEIYKSAAEGAKSTGDDRKARMHQRIVKQYQDAIKAHKAGRPISLSELPVPPGCPPLQGSEQVQQQSFIGVLETAIKIAHQDADAEDENADGPQVAKPAAPPHTHKAKSPAAPAPGDSAAVKLGPKAQQQLDFLLLRRQSFMRAALHSKHMKDMTAAAQHLRHAKGLDTMITAATAGLPVDISKIPSIPISEEDYSLSHSRTSPRSARSSEQYHGLMELLRKQHEKCLGFSQQFIELGNVAEALKFEKLLNECMKNLDILKNAYAQGHPVPKCRTEERKFTTIRNNPKLAPNDLMLYIIRGVNLPAPSGVSPDDLDASVKFEFPFPSVEDAQRDKTSTVKDTNNPEFKEQFRLNINRSHRGFRRVVQSKGIKFEIIHKGGFFKTDKIVGTAQLKLDSLENHCEIRELVEVMDGRKPTGGKLEVQVKIREPLSGSDLQSVKEMWRVLDPVTYMSPPERQKEQALSPRSKPRHETSSRTGRLSSAPPQYKLHSFSLLNYDKDRMERKIADYRKNRRDPPSDLVHQHKEICHRLQWQKSQLEGASSGQLTEYENVLCRFVQGLADSVKKFSSQGNREAAKDALGRLKMVENEMESLKRKRTG
ncbi:coiled-coil and C2 domain-containing protein 1A [Thalassophryne amazonica]|uniref:coiled-coil and C2 domain-containing protein 1A n=1 Tax=Thalassophryne amazonica TaxID=390379 RepID=UPI0014710CE7|nr:coiled-coil and C2 domain-containing protein 1A [Thalassophryne amazonica]